MALAGGDGYGCPAQRRVTKASLRALEPVMGPS
jgi:hypothetical protein